MAQEPGNQPIMDADDLYREEVFTDRKVGSIRCLTPVKQDGSDDESRATQFIGQAQLMTPAGALPLQFELQGPDLASAVAQYPEAAGQAVEDTMKQLEEMRREASSSIVLPDGAGGGPGPGRGGGGLGGLG